MTTHRAIVDALFKSANDLESVVLATVVRITGSSYGGVGTRMVARVDGSTVGIVSGGCLESDLAEHARDVNATRVPRVVTYDTRADDDTAWGLGLGCNGLIEVLLEPLTPAEAAAVGTLIEQALSATSPRILVTVISADPERDGPRVGAHALFDGDVIETTGEWGDTSLLGIARGDLTEAMASGRRGLVRDYDGVSLAFETISPAIRLIVCGTGPDVLPLVKFGHHLGWSLTIVDHRPAAPEHQARFPGATLIECSEPPQLEQCVSITPSTASVVMSHHYTRDLEYVRALIASPAPYIGILGPRARGDKMLKEMDASEREAGGTRIFSPIGMDLGGDGAEAIALSIVAEVTAAIRKRSGVHLRDRSSPLH